MPQNPIILSTGALFHLPLEEVFALAQGAHFDGIEIIIDDTSATRDPKFIRSLMNEYAVSVFSVHAPMSACSIFGDGAAEIVEGSLGLAEAVGARGLVIHPERKGIRGYARDIVSVLRRYGVGSNIMLFLENVPRKDVSLMAEPLYDPRHLSQLYAPLCLDTSHLATSKLDFSAVVEAVAGRVGHVHFSDSTITMDERGYVSDEHLPVGRGKLPLTRAVKSLSSTGYQGAYCLELRPTLFEGISESKVAPFLGDLCDSVRRLVSSASVDRTDHAGGSE